MYISDFNSSIFIIYGYVTGFASFESMYEIKIIMKYGSKQDTELETQHISHILFTGSDI